MGKRGTLTVRVISDTKAAERGLTQFGNTVDRTAQRFENAGKKMTMFATVPIVGAMTLATNAASELEQAVGGTEAVFGEARDTIDRYAKDAARNAGLSERAFREATTSIGGQLKRMTGDVDFAAEKSIELTQVAADLAATYGGTTAEAVQALGAAFRGEADPAERFNLNLKVSAVNAKAVELGLARTTSEVSENARAQATLALITEQSADAQGQFAREAETAAGSTQIARAEIENAAAELGDSLAPLAAKAAGGIADLAASFADLPEPVQNGVLALAGIVAAAGPAMTAFAKVSSGAAKASDAFETMRLRSMYLKDSLGTAGLAGAVGIAGAAIVAATLVLGDYNRKKAEASERSASLRDALESEAGAVDDAVDAALAAELANERYASSVRESGVSFASLTDAVKDHGDAMGELRRDYINMSQLSDGLTRALEENGLAGTAFGDSLLELADHLTVDEMALLIQDLDELSGSLQGQQEALANSEQATSDLADESGTLSNEMGTAGDAAEDLEDSLSDAEQQAAALEDAANKLSDAMDALAGAQIAADEAAIQYQAEMASLTETLAEHGAELDFNTEAGRANSQQIIATIEAIQDHAEAVVRETGSTRAATEQTIRHVDALKQTMRQAGFTEDQINDLIDRYNLTPNEIRTTVRLLGADSAEQQLQDLVRNRTANISAIVSLGGSGAGRAILAGDARRHAGGRVQPDVAYTIGRPGHEELFVPDSPGRVVAGIDTDQALAAGASGTTNNYNVTIQAADTRSALDQFDFWARSNKVVGV